MRISGNFTRFGGGLQVTKPTESSTPSESGYNLANLTFVGTRTASNTNGAAFGSFQFGAAGTKLFVGETTNGNVAEHNLTGTAYDVGFTSAATRRSALASGGGVYGVDISTDGTRMILADTFNTVTAKVLNTPWSLASVGSAGSATFGAPVYGAAWADSGNKVILVQGQDVRCYDTSTAYDVTGLSGNSFTSITLASSALYPSFSPSGTYFTVLEQLSGDARRYVTHQCSTPFDLSTATYHSELNKAQLNADGASLPYAQQDAHFADNGARFYVRSGSVFNEYSVA